MLAKKVLERAFVTRPCDANHDLTHRLALLRSAVTRVSTLSPWQWLTVAGGAAAVLVVAVMLILNTRSKPASDERPADTVHARFSFEGRYFSRGLA